MSGLEILPGATSARFLLRGKPAFGMDAVRITLKSDWEEPGYSLTWEPKRAELSSQARWATAPARWGYHGKNEKGEKIILQGDHLTVWQKHSDELRRVI